MRRVLLVGLATGALHASGGGNQGGSGQGDNGGRGAGTATPELPSGVLFGLGLVPLGAGLFLAWRRRRTDLA